MKKHYRNLNILENEERRIKEKYSKLRYNFCTRKCINLKTRELRLCLYIIKDLHIPKDSEEKEMLKMAIRKIDKIISELEKTIYYAKLNIKEKG